MLCLHSERALTGLCGPVQMHPGARCAKVTITGTLGALSNHSDRNMTLPPTWCSAQRTPSHQSLSKNHGKFMNRLGPPQCSSPSHPRHSTNAFLQLPLGPPHDLIPQASHHNVSMTITPAVDHQNLELHGGIGSTNFVQDSEPEMQQHSHQLCGNKSCKKRASFGMLGAPRDRSAQF